jgi:chromosome segregation ATPase
MDRQRGCMSPTRLSYGFESDASTAATPERCSSHELHTADCSICLEVTSAAKTVRRGLVSGDYMRRITELEASLQESQQRCANLQIRLDESHPNSSGHLIIRGAASDYIEECINYMERCEALEKSIRSTELEKQELQARLSESVDVIALFEMRIQQSKADSEGEIKRLASVTEVLRKELNQSRAAAQGMEEECSKLRALLRVAHEESKVLQKQLSDSQVASDFKASSQLQTASDALAAAEKRASIEVKAAEARAVQVKVSADAEVKRCRSEAERLVKELGEAKATINDYMWRCEAMESSLRNTQQNLTAASEATAATERRALMDLEAAVLRAQDAQAVSDAEMQRWRDALTESAATVSKFIVHSSDLQRRLDVSQAECIDLQKLIARISR